MSRQGPTPGVRARVTIVTALVVALSMLALTTVVGYGVERTLVASTSEYLRERVEVAAAALRQGNVEGAVDTTGPVVLQVLDSDGTVLASSVPALDGTPLAKPVQDEDEVDGDDEGDDADEGLAAGDGVGAARGAQPSCEDDDADDADDDAGVTGGGVVDADDDDHDADDVADDADDDDAYDHDADDDAYDAYDAEDDTDDSDDADDDDDDRGNWVRRNQRWLLHTAGALIDPLAVATANTTPLDERTLATLSDEVGLRGPFLTETQQVSAQGRRLTVVGLASLAAAADTATSAVRLLAIASVLVIAGASVFTWRMVGRTLAPVEEMRASTVSLVNDDPNGRIDVTGSDRDLRELAATFNDLLARSERALVEQRRFVSDASHQLKSPVAAQRVMIETLRSHPDASDSGEVLDDLARENNRLQGIVEDLLALARHDEGFVPTKAPVDLIDVVFEEVAALASYSHVAVDTSGIEPIVVSGDARMLGQALRNLLDNAARYAASEVRVSCSEQGGVARIVVSDDGPGIPEQDRERVFERFVRLEEGSDVAPSSTGLGLAVVRSVVEGHSGRVWFERAAEGGAAAVIELPLR